MCGKWQQDQLPVWRWHTHSWHAPGINLVQQHRINKGGKIYDSGCQEFLPHDNTPKMGIDQAKTDWHPSWSCQGMHSDGESGKIWNHLRWSQKRDAWTAPSRIACLRATHRVSGRAWMLPKQNGSRTLAPQDKTHHLHTGSRWFWSEVHKQRRCTPFDECAQTTLRRHRGLERWKVHRDSPMMGLQRDNGSHGNAWTRWQGVQRIPAWPTITTTTLTLRCCTQTVWSKGSSHAQPRRFQGSHCSREEIHPASNRRITLPCKSRQRNTPHSAVCHSIKAELTNWRHAEQNQTLFGLHMWPHKKM